MTNQYLCAECGIPFPIMHQGFLALPVNDAASLAVFKNGLKPKLIENKLYIPYDSIQSLEEEIQMLEEGGLGEIRAAVTGSELKVPLMIELSVLKERIRNKEMVDVIVSNKFVSYFQPIINLKSHDLFGYEALLRVDHSEKQVPPGMLFEAAHKTGLYSLLDQRARETAIKSRVGKIPNGMKTFINFLPSTIYNPEFCLQHTFSIVDKYNVSPSDLVFEVVETEEINDIDHLKNIFKTYKASGMKVALDDVGSGFATLDILSKLQPDYVKLDRNFISYCDQNTMNQKFLQQAVHISKEMGIKVLGEGIERKEELEFCAAIGMDFAQGYYLGKPVKDPVEQVRA
ncbi:EAL domain-containing protein [Heyndrickxia acidicola]|uniref:EAL domain-containing protein n=1 Tax=Heyndrickxia acidicola TaxID=209389 RepID=A0ABU6MHA6_9BACI|nr:EAL domain-containing protein [Heyndrickxia acidicola]MED1203814.1 EAL domain-containing protein [Heyndrickxia acidicola]